MAIIYNDNLAINANKPVDNRYLYVTRPWLSIAEVNATIPESYRYSGLTVNVQGNEYWYKNGLGNLDLIEKSTGSVGVGTINDGGNGITKVGDTLILGGIITGNTTLLLGNNINLTFSGNSTNLTKYSYKQEYISDLSSTYNARTIPDVGYVTGLTDNLRNNKYDFIVVTGDTTINNNIYLVLVNNAVGGGITLTLTTTPFNGQAYKIKDITGNASNNNITIYGNSKNIDGEDNAIINTNYGAVEIVYYQTFDEWYTLGFVN